MWLAEWQCDATYANRYPLCHSYINRVIYAYDNSLCAHLFTVGLVRTEVNFAKMVNRIRLLVADTRRKNNEQKNIEKKKKTKRESVAMEYL